MLLVTRLGIDTKNRMPILLPHTYHTRDCKKFIGVEPFIQGTMSCENGREASAKWGKQSCIPTIDEKFLDYVAWSCKWLSVDPREISYWCWSTVVATVLKENVPILKGEVVHATSLLEASMTERHDEPLPKEMRFYNGFEEIYKIDVSLNQTNN